MRLGSARMAWHDAYYTPWDSTMHHGLEMVKLAKRGYVANETMPERWETTGRCAHQAVAGRVQNAIAGLHWQCQFFGHNLYAPVIDTRTSNAWEEVAVSKLEGRFLLRMESEGQTLAPSKRAVLWFVCRGVLARYRHMVQGGMGSNCDPMEAPHVFRAWLFDQHGIELERRNWRRDWGWIIQRLFDEASDLDTAVLAPVSRVLAEERGEQCA